MKHIPLLEYHLTNHCNLNCKGCAHFAPLADPWFADLDSFKKDLTRLTSKVVIDGLILFGGEPLLHPQINDFVQVARELLPTAQISVLTNGVELLKKIPLIKDTFKNNNIIVDVTSYPIDVNYKLALKLLETFGIKYKIYNDLEPVKTLRHHRLSHERQKNEWNCLMINSKSVQLKEGKLYLCPIQAYIDIFNKYFNENYHVTEDCYLNIYDDITDDDIVNMYFNKNSFCEYCREPIEGNTYSTSRREKQEWT
jgi:organic radical activating enzyme